MKRVIGIFLAVILLLLWPMFRRHSPISERMITGGIGLDIDDDRYMISAQLLGDERQVVTVDGVTVGQAVSSAVETTGQGLELRQNRLFCVGERTAKTGELSALTDYLVRSGNGRLTADMVVCRGAASELLGAVSVDQLVDLTEKSVTVADGVRCRLLDVQRTLTDTGDAIIPIVRMTEDKAGMDGAALFRAGRWITDLSHDQTTGLALAAGQAKQCTVVCETEEGSVTVELGDIRRSIQVESAKDEWRFWISIQARATVVENAGDANIHQLNRLISDELSHRMTDAVTVTAQTYGCDVCGLTDAAKKQMPFAASAVDGKWEQHLKSGQYTCLASVTVTEAGLRN